MESEDGMDRTRRSKRLRKKTKREEKQKEKEKAKIVEGEDENEDESADDSAQEEETEEMRRYQRQVRESGPETINQMFWVKNRKTNNRPGARWMVFIAYLGNIHSCVADQCGFMFCVCLYRRLSFCGMRARESISNTLGCIGAIAALLCLLPGRRRIRRVRIL